MFFNSLDEMWRMGGHGPFVWTAYILAAITLIVLIVVPLQRQRHFFSEQVEGERRRAARASSISNSTSPDSNSLNSSSSLNSSDSKAS